MGASNQMPVSQPQIGLTELIINIGDTTRNLNSLLMGIGRKVYAIRNINTPNELKDVSTKRESIYEGGALLDLENLLMDARHNETLAINLLNHLDQII